MKKGFTLVELVVVLVLLSVGLVTLLLVLRNASVSNATAHIITVANELGEGKIEEILADRKTQGFDYIKNLNYPTEDPVTGFNSYMREVDIYYVDLSDLDTPVIDSNYKRVEVSVNSKGGVEPAVKLITIVSKR